jgi:uncharacterized Zn-finger protein
MFKEKAEVQRHMTDHKELSANKIFYCRVCKRHLRMEFMQVHMSFHHESSEKEKFVCDICKRIFTESTSLLRHLLIHKEMSERRMFFCPYIKCSK